MKPIIKYSILLVMLVIVNSCKKDFLTRPPQDSTTSGNFYTTNAEVMAGTVQPNCPAAS